MRSGQPCSVKLVYFFNSGIMGNIGDVNERMKKRKLMPDTLGRIDARCGLVNMTNEFRTVVLRCVAGIKRIIEERIVGIDKQAVVVEFQRVFFCNRHTQHLPAGGSVRTEEQIITFYLLAIRFIVLIFTGRGADNAPLMVVPDQHANVRIHRAVIGSNNDSAFGTTSAP